MTRFFNRDGAAGFGGFGERDPAPKDMPGAERFSPDYDGPMPEGRSKKDFPDAK